MSAAPRAIVATVLASLLPGVVLAQPPGPSQTPQRADPATTVQAGVTFDTNMGDAGTWFQVTPTGGVTLDERWSLEAGLPIYFLAASATDDGSTAGGIGDLYLSVSFDVSGGNSTAYATATLGAPTGNADAALGAGTATWDVSGYVDRGVGPFTPSVYAGIGNNSLMAASAPSRQLYRSAGFLFHVEGWAEVEVASALSLSGGLYAVRSMGSESGDVDAETGDSSDDQGFQLVASTSLARALNVSLWFTRSTAYAYNTYSISVGVDIAGLLGKPRGSSRDRKGVRR
jgi:hypothetical protein